MMKIRSFVLLLVLFPLVAQGQRLLLRSGLSMYRYSTDFPGQFWSPGMTASIGFEMPISPVLSIQAELGWIQKGFRWKVYDEYMVDDQKHWLLQRRRLEVSYLELPILISRKLPFKKVDVHVYGGLYVAYGLTGRYTFDGKESTILPPYIKIDHETKDLVFGEWDGETEGYEVIQNRTDLGIQIGARVSVFRKLMIDVRYGYGFVDMYDVRADSWVSTGLWHESKNRAFQFSVMHPIFSFKNSQ